MAINKQFPVDDLVKNIFTEKNTIPTDMTMFFGFIGEGKSEETITVYLDTLLRQAIEIAKEDVLHTVKLNKTQNPIGGTMIWLNNATKYIYGNQRNIIQDQRIAQNYFGGDVYQQYVTQAQETNARYQQPVCCPQHKN